MINCSKPKLAFRNTTLSFSIKKLLFLVALTAPLYISAQTVYFNHIAQEDGLRNGNVRAIIQDHQGFMWIGTEDGLHRYDGHAMKIYRNREDDSTSLASNFIMCLFEDSRNNLWVGTLDGGLHLYNREKDSFRRFKLPARTRNAPVRVAIRSITEDSNHWLYVGSDNLVRSKISSPDSIRFNSISLPTDTVSDTGVRVSSIVESFDSGLLISVNTQGLFYFDAVSGRSHPHEMYPLEKNIQAVYIDKLRKLIWIGSWKNGILVYDPARKIHRHITADGNSKSIRSNFIAAITGDAEGNIWIASDNGLSMVPKDSDPFDKINIITYLPDNTDKTGIRGTVFKSVYVDHEERVWAGSYYEGLNVYDRKTMNFGSLAVPVQNNNGTTDGNINALQEDQAGNLWLGLDGGGLYVLDKQPDGGALLPRHIVTTENIDKIKSMKFDSDQNLWIGTWGNGLFVFNTRTGQCRKMNSKGMDVGPDIISLESDKAGNLWIGTFDKGLFRYAVNKKQVEKITAAEANSNLIDRIIAIHADSSGNLWIGKEVGGLHYLPEGETKYKAIHAKHLEASTTVSTLYQDRYGILWIGVPTQGLIEYHPDANQTFAYGESQGLANSAIYAIQEDTQHRLWISHSAGLSVFDKKTKRFTNFTRGNGLTANQFNRNSQVKRKNGHMVFGNIRGLNYFNPDSFEKSLRHVPVVFTKFLINNIEQTPGAGILGKNITTVSQIDLHYYQNSFSLEFAALGYNFSHHTEYEYILEDFEDHWQDAGDRRLVSYTNIPPGEYTFNVRASSRGMNESIPPSRIQIHIIPAWWQTILFKAGIVISLILIGLFTHILRVRFLRRQKVQLEDEVTARTKKLNDTIDEVNAINNVLQIQQDEIQEKNNEILAQNEELHAQNEQIVLQQDNLIQAREELKEMNNQLEKTVDERTQQLQQTIGNLNKSVFELDRFVYSASHDLSAPLKSIHGLVEVIKLEKNLDKVYEYMDLVKRTVLKLETVLKSMTDYSRNSHVLVKSELFNLKELIDEVISELAFQPEAYRMIYRNEVPGDYEAQTDRGRLKIILHNLISNGIKYSDSRKETCWIKFEYVNTEKTCILRITDNGIGIRTEYLEKIFNMYFRATEASKGSGLGLYIVKETVRKIGGEITVESEYGVSTVFTIEVPKDIQSE